MSAPERNPAEREEEHPRGALVFILVYLLIIVVFWLNTYLRLWIRS
jgi:uncharacterized RDD family membrane protein YckC